VDVHRKSARSLTKPPGHDFQDEPLVTAATWAAHELSPNCSLGLVLQSCTTPLQQQGADLLNSPPGIAAQIIGLGGDNPEADFSGIRSAVKATLQALKRLGSSGAAAAEGELAGATSAERAIIGHGQSIIRSSEFGALRAANAAGKSAEVSAGGTTIVYEPGLPASGMTLFGENGFVLGPEAFSSEAELGHTVLWELYRLGTSSSSGGVSGALASSETSAAQSFATRYSHLLGGG
jgi:hypothetical protein